MAESVAKYQQYEEYKDSEVEWSEKIPTHWKTASLSKLFMIKAGGDLQPALFSETKTLEHQHPIYTNANDSKAVYGYTKKPNFPSNTITVSGRGEVGFAVYRNHEFDAIIRLLVLIPFIKLDGRFFAYFINEVIDFNVQSSAIGQLSTLQISPYKVIIPPYEEQYLISNYLDYETAQIDTLIEKQQTLIQLLREKRQAVVSHAVTKGLNPDAPMKDSGVEWLGEVPEHWELPKLIHQTSKIGDGLHSTPQYQDGTGYYFVNGNNLVSGQIVVSTTSKEVPEDEYKKHYIYLDNSSVLLSINGTIGNVARYNNEMVILGKSAAYMNCADSLLPEYLMVFLQSSQAHYYFDLEVTGTTIYNLSLNSIRQMRVCIPPKQEQSKIHKFCELQQNKYDTLIEKASTAIRLMQERRTALISAAVTGKIDVRGWVAPDNI